MNRNVWPIVGLAFLCLGCTSVSKSSTTRMRWSDGTHSFSYSSPKDQTIGSLTIDPKTGAVTVSNLSSQVDQAAVAAARDARIADAQATSAIVSGALGLAQDAMRARAGLPPSTPTPATATPQAARTAPEKAVPDDPSRIRLILPDGTEVPNS